MVIKNISEQLSFAHFPLLPNELQCRILSFANPRDFPNVSKVCRLFHHFIFNIGLDGENYKEFIVSFLVHHETQDFPEHLFGWQIPPTYSKKIRDHGTSELKKIMMPFFMQMMEYSKSEYKRGLTNREMVVLSKPFRNLEFMRAKGKINNLMRFLTPIQQQLMQKLFKGKDEALRQIARDLEKMNDEENATSENCLKERMGPVHNELLSRVEKVKAEPRQAALAQGMAALAPPPIPLAALAKSPGIDKCLCLAVATLAIVVFRMWT